MAVSPRQPYLIVLWGRVVWGLGSHGRLGAVCHPGYPMGGMYASYVRVGTSRDYTVFCHVKCEYAILDYSGGLGLGAAWQGGTVHCAIHS